MSKQLFFKTAANGEEVMQHSHKHAPSPFLASGMLPLYWSHLKIWLKLSADPCILFFFTFYMVSQQFGKWFLYRDMGCSEELGKTRTEKVRMLRHTWKYRTT